MLPLRRQFALLAELSESDVPLTIVLVQGRMTEIVDGVEVFPIGEVHRSGRVVLGGVGKGDVPRHGRPDPVEVVVSGVATAHERQPAARLEGTADVGERGDRIGEVHDPATADRDVEAGLGQSMGLRVALVEGDIDDLLLRRRTTCPFQHRPGQVEADRVPGQCAARGHPGGPAGATADVEHPVTRLDRGSCEERSVHPLEQDVVAAVVVGPVPALVPVPRLRLLSVDDVHGRRVPTAPLKVSTGRCQTAGTASSWPEPGVFSGAVDGLDAAGQQ